MEELEESVWSVVRQENEREEQGEGVHNSGKTSIDVRGRDMGVEEEHEHKSETAEIRMPRWMCGVKKLDKISNERIRGTKKGGGNHKESTGEEAEVAWACDETGGTLRRKEGDGNESTGANEERKTYLREDGWTK